MAVCYRYGVLWTYPTLVVQSHHATKPNKIIQGDELLYIFNMKNTVFTVLYTLTNIEWHTPTQTTITGVGVCAASTSLIDFDKAVVTH